MLLQRFVVHPEVARPEAVELAEGFLRGGEALGAVEGRVVGPSPVMALGVEGVAHAQVTP